MATLRRHWARGPMNYLRFLRRWKKGRASQTHPKRPERKVPAPSEPHRLARLNNERKGRNHMNQTASRFKKQNSDTGVARVDMKFEVSLVPVSDVDRAKEFYTKLGWRLDDRTLY